MFASVDLAGSTAFKQRQANNSARWAGTFRVFFKDFPSTLQNCFDNVQLKQHMKPTRPMRVWKFVGDEILFVTELERHEQAAFHAIAFLHALDTYTDELRCKPELQDLSLKGTLWGAGFPVTNVEVSPPLGDHISPLDYLGPEVDLGFRLTRLANNRRVPVSLDIAYFLSMIPSISPYSLFARAEEPELHKGLARAYPFIWLDRRNGEFDEEDIALQRRKPVHIDDLKRYVEFMYANRSSDFVKPFIASDPNENFSAVPDHMLQIRERLRDESRAVDAVADKAEPPTVQRGECEPPAPRA
jgi:hypothetical protein